MIKGDVPMKKLKRIFCRCAGFFEKKLLLWSLAPLALATVLLAILIFFDTLSIYGSKEAIVEFLPSLIATALLSLFLIYPLVLTFLNFIFLLRRTPDTQKRRRQQTVIELVTLGFGAVCTFFWFNLMSNIQFADWSEQLYNAELHSPIQPRSLPTVIVLGAVALLGYAVLRIVPAKKLPPLTAALSIAALYIGIALSIALCVQLAKGEDEVILALLPLNLILIFLKFIREVVTLREPIPDEDLAQKNGLVRGLNRFLNKSRRLPWVGLLLALPLLGVVIAVLCLFGQAPDSIIQAWTQTAGWTFSMQNAPENLIMDEHYLCTVAAGGHQRVVKPLRLGRRHGHEVIVNRQLCVANAFEQLLMERTPRFHHALRSFYDRFGYPIAKHIRTPLAADIVWLVMKPLEWLFLAVLYLFDAKPENRIAVQYPHAPVPHVAD